MALTSPWTRKHILSLAVRYPGLMSALLFFFLFAVSNHLEFTSGMALQSSPFWHMLLVGAVMASFAAILLYEVIRLHRQLAEVRMVRHVVSTLHHEINNPLLVIQLSAEKLQALRAYDDPTVKNILDYGTVIRDVVVQLGSLDYEVRLRVEPGFENLIDIARSR